MGYETIRYEVTEAIATITLNRPDAYNALNLALGRELFHATLEADEDRAVRCIVITGAGKAFCAGGDVKDFNDNPDRIGGLIKELSTYLHGSASRPARTAQPGALWAGGHGMGPLAPRASGRGVRRSGGHARARARPGADARLRPRQASFPPVHPGEPGDADGARGPGHRPERPHGGFP